MAERAEILSLAELTEMEFLRLYERYGIASAPEKRKADMIDSLWPDIYQAVFKPDGDFIRYNNTRSKLRTYDVGAVEAVCDMFIKLNKRYGGVIKFNQFANLTGINRYTLYLWHKANNTKGYLFNLSKGDIDEEFNNLYIYVNGNNGNINYQFKGNMCLIDSGNLSTMRFDVIKKLQEEMQDSNTNGLSNDTMGHALRANNEDELGKLYEPRRMVHQEQIKRVLTAQELPRLDAELTGNGKQFAITGGPEDGQNCVPYSDN